MQANESSNYEKIYTIITIAFNPVLTSIKERTLEIDEQCFFLPIFQMHFFFLTLKNTITFDTCLNSFEISRFSILEVILTT